MIFGILSCIPNLLFSVLAYLAIHKGLPPWFTPTLSATARSLLHTYWFREGGGLNALVEFFCHNDLSEAV